MRTASSMSTAMSSFRELLEGCSARRSDRITTPFVNVDGMLDRRMPRRAHQGVGVRQQVARSSGRSAPARRRPEEVAVVDGEHDGAPGRRPKDPGEAVAHAPVELVRALEMEALVRGRDLG